MKWSVVSLDSFDPNSKKMDGIYKADNFINDIAYFKKSSALQENDRYLRFLICYTDDNLFKTFKYVGNNVN